VSLLTKVKQELADFLGTPHTKDTWWSMYGRCQGLVETYCLENNCYDSKRDILQLVLEEISIDGRTLFELLDEK